MSTTKSPSTVYSHTHRSTNMTVSPKLHLPSMLIGIVTSWLGYKLVNRYGNTLKSLIYTILYTKQSIDTTQSIDSLLQYYILLNGIKINKRTGWIDCGVQNVESIADHQYTMSMIAHTLVHQHNSNVRNRTYDDINKYDCNMLSVDKCIKLALIHDICESICGDITPEQWSGVTKTQKHSIELNALHTLCNTIGMNTVSATELNTIWNEYENCSSSEAYMIKDIDKLEMVIQAYIYESTQLIDLSEFYDNIRSKLKHTVSLQLYDAVIRKRKQLLLNTQLTKHTKRTAGHSNVTAQSLINTLQLESHPEGGYFKRIYTSQRQLLDNKSLSDTTNLNKFPRALTTSIYYMLCDSQFSALHKIPCDELWHHYCGDDICIVELITDNNHTVTDYKETILGHSTQQYVYNVPAHTYFAAYRVHNHTWKQHNYVLVGCTVVPGFEFNEWIMPDRQTLIDMYMSKNNEVQYKKYVELVSELTHN